MMRIAGRSDDGLAKAVKSDADGNIGVVVKSLVSSDRMLIPLTKPVKLNIPTPDGSGQCVHPSVVKMPNAWNGYIYWMAFTPFPNGDYTKENPCIVASNDGINWVVPTGVVNPLVPAPTTGWNADTVMMFTGTAMRIYYSVYGVAPTLARYIESTDGVNWSSPVTVTGAAGPLTTGGMVRVKSNEWIATPSQGPLFTQERFVSTNGLNWVGDRPILQNLGGELRHGQIFYDGSGFHHMTCASGWEASIADIKTSGNNLYYGYSLDEYRIYYDPTPVLIPEPGTWYARTIYTSCLVPFNNQEHVVYFSAFNDAGACYIGMMKVKLNLDITKITSKSLKPKTMRNLLKDFAIRDTTTQYVGGGFGVPMHEFNEYPNKILQINNSMDQDVRLSIISDQQYYLGSTATPQQLTIPKNGTWSNILVTKDQLAVLGMLMPDRVIMTAKCTVAPTTGALTVKLVAWE